MVESFIEAKSQSLENSFGTKNKLAGSLLQTSTLRVEQVMITSESEYLAAAPKNRDLIEHFKAGENPYFMNVSKRHKSSNSKSNQAIPLSHSYDKPEAHLSTLQKPSRKHTMPSLSTESKHYHALSAAGTNKYEATLPRLTRGERNVNYRSDSPFDLDKEHMEARESSFYLKDRKPVNEAESTFYREKDRVHDKQTPFDSEKETMTDTYSKWHRKAINYNESSCLSRQPMNDKESIFYLDRALVDVDLYQEGLAEHKWNPTQVLFEICNQSKWGHPQYMDKFVTGEYLVQLTVKGIVFHPDKADKVKKTAKHRTSAQFLKFLGFQF